MEVAYVPKLIWGSNKKTRYLISSFDLVATCEQCVVKEPGKKTRLRYRRAQMPRSLKSCPDCGHALFWERISRGKA